MNTHKITSIKSFEKLAISQTQADQLKGGGRGNAAIIIDWGS